MLYNVLQACHGGHSLCVFYVRVKTLTNREQKDAKKCTLGGDRLRKKKRNSASSSLPFLFILQPRRARSNVFVIRQEKEDGGMIRLYKQYHQM